MLDDPNFTQPPVPPPPDGGTLGIGIEEEMERSYLDYAMSVIVSRALPDVRDGLKPVHRRILYGMKESGYDAGKPYRKSARIVGTVMGKYHPHGDSAIYDAMVRMAQDFSMRLTLVDGQGNYGSMDGDAPAAMRYTEARLALSAEALLEDIDSNTVDFIANYDDSEQEPAVLPARFPNLLVNGAGGIAVGMATNIPPHNLGETIAAAIALIDNPDLDQASLNEIVPGPDFPTGGIIQGRLGIQQAQASGRGSVVIRAAIEVETFAKDRQALVVSEIPYQVNKSKMIERIADLVRDKTIEGISDLRDESDRDGVRVVIELKRGVEPDVLKAQLFRHTPLQSSFGVNMLALDHGQPRIFSLKDALLAFNDFREEVVRRRTEFLLAKARNRAHVLAGLLVAIQNLDPVIELIRKARDPLEARTRLMAVDWPAGEVAPFIALIDDPAHQINDDQTYRLSEAQARAILDLRLQRLTGLELDKLQEETRELAERIKGYLEIITDRSVRVALIKEELQAVSDRFATPRRTRIEESGADHDIEDLIQREDMVVTATMGGYIKRVPLSTYRAQRRGGKGRTGMATKDDDFVARIFVANTHTPVLFFSSTGMVYRLKVYRLPIGQPQSKGKALINLLPLSAGETITTIMPMPDVSDVQSAENADQSCLFFATANGQVRRNLLSDFVNIRASGKIAMKLEDGDSLIGVRPCEDTQDIMLASEKGACIRFPVTAIRIFVGRSSSGVRGIKLAEGDRLISMTILNHGAEDAEERNTYLQAMMAARRLSMSDPAEDTDEADESDPDVMRDQERAELLQSPPYSDMQDREQFILTLADTGMAQLASAYSFRVTNRGGKGISNMDARGGKIVGSFRIDPALDEVMLVTDGGQVIRCPVDGLTPRRRGGVGVRMFNIEADQKLVSVARISVPPEADEETADEETADEEAADEETVDEQPPDEHIPDETS